MPTENKAVPFAREDRYIVLKLKRLPKDEAEYLRDCHPKAMVECVVVESDWPEYQLVWAMIEHRMAGKPVPDFSLWRRADALQALLTAADERADVLEGLLRTSLVAMTRIYSSGRDFIVGAGSDCDSVELMMENDPTAREIRAALKPAEPAKEGHVCTGCGNKGWTANCKECVPY